VAETFLFLQKLLKETTGIPLSRIPYNRAALLHFLQEQTNRIFDELVWEKSNLWHHLFHIPAQTDTIYAWTAPGGIGFLMYGDSVADSGYVLGPVLAKPYSKESILQDMAHLHIGMQEKTDFLLFCSKLPVVERHILHKAGDLVIGHLTRQEKPMQITQISVPILEESVFHADDSSDGDIVQMRQVETRYEYSAALTDAVRQGNLSLALHLIGRYDPSTQTPVRNTNPLRNAQNYCIVLNTQLRHALEQSGIHPYSVDRLSNQIGMEIEQLKHTRQFPDFFRSVLQRYCRLVQEHNYPDLKPLTHLAVTYIKEHLADNLTVKDTAAVLTVNANYLSGLFHRDMGMTFIDFVNKERTKQAAALLRHTNLQVGQIASTVGYNNTSYFAKQFLRFHGISPSHYRRG